MPVQSLKTQSQNVERILCGGSAGEAAFRRLIAPVSAEELEALAQRALQLTRRHFGRTISLYAPLYVANYCAGGCRYCGFASDRHQPRRRLTRDQLDAEMASLRQGGIQDILLLTGEADTPEDFDHLADCVRSAAATFHAVSIESFAMTEDQYRTLADAGCTGVTIYQETYDPDTYAEVHRWGQKRDYAFRRAAPQRALNAGLRSVGLGVLLGLSDPREDATALYRHVQELRKTHWKAGISLSFPRLRSAPGSYTPRHPVSDPLMAQLIWAFRITFPDLPLVLSTREAPAFRDAMAGLGVSRMSVASRTTVGGYAETSETERQFPVHDSRDVGTFCDALRRHDLSPVFKNWDAVFVK